MAKSLVSAAKIQYEQWRKDAIKALAVTPPPWSELSYGIKMIWMRKAAGGR